jgi:hypothetical protein
MAAAIFLNTEEIAEAVKISTRYIKRYVKEQGLPAFQERPGGKWCAWEETLRVWAAAFEKKCLGGVQPHRG